MTVDVSTLPTIPDRDDNDLLYGPSGRIRIRNPDVDLEGEVLYLDEGILGAAWEKMKHPRWPKGTKSPHGEDIGGQFMKVGERFEKDGKLWEIAHLLHGKVYAHEASANYQKVGLLELKPDKDADGGLTATGLAPVSPKVTSGGKSDSSISGDLTIIDPYVDHDSHVPALKLPAGSKLKPDEWQRFGKIDQENYIELMHRFGGYAAAKVQPLHHKMYEDYDHTVQQIVKNAYQHQYGSSSGSTFSLAQLFKGGKGGKQVESNYVEARSLFNDLSAVLQWDLYNRTRSPDVALFHKGNTSAQKYVSTYITGNKPIFSGYSQSFKFSANDGFGPNTIATPTAIRHVVMSSYSTQPIPGENHFASEYEIAVAEQIKLDDRSVAFQTSTMGLGSPTTGNAVRKWLQGVTEKPASGDVIQKLKDVWAGKGEVPIPPEPADITYAHTGGKLWKELPAATGTLAGQMAWGLGGHQKLGYADASGEPTSHDASKMLATEMNLKPGSFMEGLKGTRYVIIADPGDDTGFGLRYVKILPDGTLDYVKSYNFDGGGTNAYHKLQGSVEIPKPKAEKGFIGFTEAQYLKLANGESKPMKDFAPGEMFKIDGEGWKVTTPGIGPHGKVDIESLDTGKQAMINALYKGVGLIKKDGFIEPQADNLGHAWTPEKGAFATHKHGLWKIDEVHGDTVKASLVGGSGALHEKALAELKPVCSPFVDEPVKGAVFAIGGKKFTVTTVMKDGTVKAKPAGGGKVEAFEPDKFDLKGKTFVPSDWGVSEKKKAKDLAVGDLVSMYESVHPYMLVNSNADGKYRFQNLETGEFTLTTGNKSWHVLKPADEQEPEGTQVQAGLPELQTDMVLGSKMTIGAMSVGQMFWVGTSLQGGAWFQKTGTNDKGDPLVKKVATANKDGSFKSPLSTGVPKSTTSAGAYFTLQPTGGSAFDPSAYQKVGTLHVDEMKPGDVVVSGSGTYMSFVSKDDGVAQFSVLTGPKAGTGVSFGVKKKFTHLMPKAEASLGDLSSYSHVNTVSAQMLQPGQVFQVGGGGLLKFVGDATTSHGFGTSLGFEYLNGPSKGKTDGLNDPDMQVKIYAPVDGGVDYESLSKGDKVMASVLKPGDELTLFKPDTVYVVIEAGEKEQDLHVAKLQSDGTPSALTVPLGPGNVVAYHGKYTSPSSAVPPTDASSLPDIAASPSGFSPYLHPKGGKFKYPKLNEMQVGDHFTDKNNSEWVVKAFQGDVAIVSDGKALYQADVSFRGKVKTDGFKIEVDKAPPVGDTVNGAALKKALAQLQPNNSSKEIQDLPTGSLVKANAGLWKGTHKVIFKDEDGYATLENVETGETSQAYPDLIMPFVSAGAVDDVPSPSPEHVSAPTSLGAVPLGGKVKLGVALTEPWWTVTGYTDGYVTTKMDNGTVKQWPVSFIVHGYQPPGGDMFFWSEPESHLVSSAAKLDELKAMSTDLLKNVLGSYDSAMLDALAAKAKQVPGANKVAVLVAHAQEAAKPLGGVSGDNGVSPVDLKPGDAFQFSHGAVSTHVVKSHNPKTGQIVSMNPVSGSEWHGNTMNLDQVFNVRPWGEEGVGGGLEKGDYFKYAGKAGWWQVSASPTASAGGMATSVSNPEMKSALSANTVVLGQTKTEPMMVPYFGGSIDYEIFAVATNASASSTANDMLKELSPEQRAKVHEFAQAEGLEQTAELTKGAGDAPPVPAPADVDPDLDAYLSAESWKGPIPQPGDKITYATIFGSKSGEVKDVLPPEGGKSHVLLVVNADGDTDSLPVSDVTDLQPVQPELPVQFKVGDLPATMGDYPTGSQITTGGISYEIKQEPGITKMVKLNGIKAGNELSYSPGQNPNPNWKITELPAATVIKAGDTNVHMDQLPVGAQWSNSSGTYTITEKSDGDIHFKNDETGMTHTQFADWGPTTVPIVVSMPGQSEKQKDVFWWVPDEFKPENWEKTGEKTTFETLKSGDVFSYLSNIYQAHEAKSGNIKSLLLTHDPLANDQPNFAQVPVPVDLMKEKPAQKFFDSLANGDKAMFKGQFPVTVSDNTVAGDGIAVEDPHGVVFDAFSDELSPMPEKAAKVIPDSVFTVEGGKTYPTIAKIKKVKELLNGMAVGDKLEVLGQQVERLPDVKFEGVEAPQKAWSIDGKKYGGGGLKAAKDLVDKAQVTPTPAASAEGEWATGVLPEVPFGANASNVKLKDLPIGSYYAYKAKGGTQWEVKKIIGFSAYGGTNVEADFGGKTETPSNNYVPPHVWIAPDPEPESAVSGDKSVPVMMSGGDNPVPLQIGQHVHVNPGTAWSDKWDGKIIGFSHGDVQVEPDDLEPDDASFYALKPHQVLVKDEGWVKGQMYKASDLPAGSQVFSSGVSGVIDKFGSVVQFGKPVVGSVGFMVEYVGPPKGEPVSVGDLDPYLHAKGGKFHYPKVGALKVGTTFSDKSKAKFKVIGHLGGTTIYASADDESQQFSTDGSHRVKVLELAEGATWRYRVRSDGNLEADWTAIWDAADDGFILT